MLLNKKVTSRHGVYRVDDVAVSKKSSDDACLTGNKIAVTAESKSNDCFI